MAEHCGTSFAESHQERISDQQLEDDFLKYIKSQREARKSKSVHVITSSCLTGRRLPPSQLQAIGNALSPSNIIARNIYVPNIEEEPDTGNQEDGNSSTDGVKQLQQQQSQTQSSELAASKKLSIHQSMENLHRPTNYRSEGRGFNVTMPVVPSNSNESLLSVSINGDDDDESDTDNTTGVSTEDDFDRRSSASFDTPKTLNIFPQEPGCPESSLRLLRPPVQAFLFSGLKVRRFQVNKFETDLYMPNLQAASRYILNSLLLNSWRSSRQQIKKIRSDNAQLKLQQNNLGLQLRVVRHLQTTEKDRMSEQTNEIHEMQSHLASLQKEQKRTAYELGTGEEELAAIRSFSERLRLENAELKVGFAEALEKKANSERLLDLEKQNGSEHAEKLSNVEQQLDELNSKIKDLTRQTNLWKDRAKESEDLGWILKRTLDGQQNEASELNDIYEEQLEKSQAISREKLDLQEYLQSVSQQLETSVHEHDSIEDVLNITNDEFQLENERVKQLDKWIVSLRSENATMMPELKNYKLKNLRRRRSIVNFVKACRYAIQFIVYGSDSAFYTMIEDGSFIRYYL